MIKGFCADTKEAGPITHEQFHRHCVKSMLPWRFASRR